MSLPVEMRQRWIDRHDKLSIRRQCRLAGISRTFLYYKPRDISDASKSLLKEIRSMYEKHPEYGSPRMTRELHRKGLVANKKRVARMMRQEGLKAITPGPHTSVPHPEHKVYPYLLRDVQVERVDQVWSTDTTYIRMPTGFLYLTAIIDWKSRYIIDWELSNTLDTSAPVKAVARCLKSSKPEIFNTDQGSQFTSPKFTKPLQDAGVKISMDGRGRALDNVFIERFWWTLKYEHIFPNVYEDGADLYQGISQYIEYYNHHRRHSSLADKAPAEIYFDQVA